MNEESEKPWRYYPHFDAAVETKSPAFLASLETTQARLERLSRSGTAREQERARAALTAYGGALALYYYITSLRDPTPSAG